MSGSSVATRASGATEYTAYLPKVPNESPACSVTSVQNTAEPLDPHPMNFPAPPYLINSQFPPGSSTPRLYVNGQPLSGPGAPSPSLYQIAPQLRPQGDWIVYVGEMANHPPSNLTGASAEYAQHNGYWGDLWVVQPNGTGWTNLTDYVLPSIVVNPVGTLNPFWSPDGTHIAWAKLVGNSPGPQSLGFWRLQVADFSVSATGVPSITNVRDLTPANANWNEVLGWSPDGTSLFVSSSAGMPYDYGADDWIVDVATGTLRDVTNEPLLWDEHGAYSPHGNEILFIQENAPSGLPGTANEPYVQWRGNLFTNYWLANPNGGDPTPVTNFTGTSGGDPIWNTTGTQALVPQIVLDPATGLPSSTSSWLITFAGNCG